VVTKPRSFLFAAAKVRFAAATFAAKWVFLEQVAEFFGERCGEFRATVELRGCVLE